MSFDARTEVSLDSNSLALCLNFDELIADDMSKVSFEKEYCQTGRRVGRQAQVTATKISILLQILTPVYDPTQCEYATLLSMVVSIAHRRYLPGS